MRSATAAEALRGLTRTRPHQRLTDPLPNDPTAIADLLREALAHHGAHAPAGPVHVLAARASATVATIGTPPSAVLKVHTDPDAYNSEAVAYALVGHSPALPGLLGVHDGSRSLLIEHISHPVDWADPSAPADLGTAVAAVHAAPAALTPELATAFDAFRLERLTAAPPPAWLPEPSAWGDVLALARNAHGGDAIPVGHLDLKPEHAHRRHGGGGLVLVDIETLRPDITGLIDLVTLPAVLRQAGHETPGREILACYRVEAARHGITWTGRGLRAALTAFARATGLDTLDGLADPVPSRRTPKDTAMEPPAPASALVADALDALGLDGPPKHLTGRKGSDVWQAGNLIVKTAVPGARGDLAHETAAYDLLLRQGRHPGARHGCGDSGRWLALPRLDGPSLWEVFAPARDGQATEAQRTTMREAADASFAALAELHAAGWIHGDVQAENVILAATGPVFIDYDRARHPNLPSPTAPYRGGLIHVIAPEIAARLLATGDDVDVPLTPAAEVYALGASLYWAWTGVRITDYRGDPAGTHTDLYADISAGRRRDITADRPWADAALETLIVTATTPTPEHRLPGAAA
ncbi:hypothetical protein ACIOMM_32630 [Streptomyces sp. NPDC087908]|uniref:hypothetical protein n=1 Tax=Streptomyces sp. NPDC087908 TaxID=3365820 RepID=UPI00380F6B96